MARFLKKRKKIKNTSPGKATFTGKKKIETPFIRLIDYNKEKLNEKELKIISVASGYKNSDTVTWINIDGLHDTKLIEKIGDNFGIHSLLLEDITDTGQRPKIEEHDEYLFLVVNMIFFDAEKSIVHSEQLSFIISDKFLITFQEKKGDVFEPVRERIRNGKGRIRTNGTDYLAYALLDMVVDNYIFTIEKIGEKIEDIEDDITDNPNSEIIDKIYTYKREMNYLRKSIRPAREAIMKLSRLENEIIDNDTLPFFKDLEGLITQATEAIDTYREMLSDQLNIYHTGLSSRMNEVMKVLTIFAAIFIPLTFITGVYGTNFEYLPELSYKYGYFIFWGVMIVIAGVMLRYFKKKDWF